MKPREIAITEKRRAIYDAIIELTKADAYRRPPTQGAIAERVGLSQKRTHDHLLVMRVLGFIAWDYGEPRSLHIVKALPTPRPPGK